MKLTDFIKQHLKTLEKATEEDWETFETEQTLPPSVSDKMLSVINTSIQPQKTKRIYYRWASVAALVLLSLAAWKWTTHPHHAGNPIAANAEVTHRWKEKINRTGKTMLLALPDSSTVELSNRSSIRYQDSFARKDRTIYLKGEALFTVASDPVRPFSVHAGGLSTTALGTVFRISSFEDNTGSTEVSLLSGKVVVRPDSLLSSKGVKEMFLKPGQQLRFDPLRLTVFVHPMKTKPLKTAASQALHPSPEKILRFNNAPLADIFRTLEKEYHCHFSYKREAIDAIRFTGSFNSTKEKLPDFLNTIGLLNNLTLTKKNNTFYILN
jgi:transmembrane sensor